VGKGGGGAARGLALGLSRTATHRPGLVQRFATHVDADTYWDAYEDTTDMRLLGSRLLSLMDQSPRIHFNLSGLINDARSIDDIVRMGADGIGQGNVTSWELYQVVSNPEFLEKTTFYLDGAIYTF
jgi:hypothetical protein